MLPWPTGAAFTQGLPLSTIQLTVTGKRCKGDWSDWSECAAGSCGSQNRTFTIPPSTEELTEHAKDETETQSESGSSRRLQKAGEHERSGDGREHNSQGGHGQQGSQTWASESQAGHDKEAPQGLAHAFASGHGQGLALALGHVECAVLNNTVQTRGCKDTCELPACAGAPSLDSATSTVPSDAAVTVSSWGCTDVGTVNGTTCIGTCPTGTITATCLNGVYTIANTTCAIDSTGES